MSNVEFTSRTFAFMLCVFKVLVTFRNRSVFFLSGDGQRDVAVSPRAPTARPSAGYCVVLLGLQVTAVIFMPVSNSKEEGINPYIFLCCLINKIQCLSHVNIFKITSGIKHFLH